MREDELNNERIWEVMEEEKSRGKRRRPIDPEERRKRRQLENDALKAIRFRDERAFAEMLRKAGIQDGSPEYVRAWKVFRSGGGQS